MVASGLTCVQETDCLTDADGNKCALDPEDDKYKCKLSGLADTACTDVDTYKKLITPATTNPAIPESFQYEERQAEYGAGSNWYVDDPNGGAATGDYPSKRAATVDECKRICDLQPDCQGISYIQPEGHPQHENTPCIIVTSTDVTWTSLTSTHNGQNVYVSYIKGASNNDGVPETTNDDAVYDLSLILI